MGSIKGKEIRKANKQFGYLALGVLLVACLVASGGVLGGSLALLKPWISIALIFGATILSVLFGMHHSSETYYRWYVALVVILLISTGTIVGFALIFGVTFELAVDIYAALTLLGLGFVPNALYAIATNMKKLSWIVKSSPRIG